MGGAKSSSGDVRKGSASNLVKLGGPIGICEVLNGQYRFDYSQVIGEGTYCTCWKGVDRDGNQVAVKRYREDVKPRIATALFRNRIRVLQELSVPYDSGGEDRTGDVHWHERLASEDYLGLFVNLKGFSVGPGGQPGPDVNDGSLTMISELAEIGHWGEGGLEPQIRHLALRRTKLSRREVQKLADEVVISVAALHSKGIVHLDIKPGNFMYFSGRLKLIDFEGCMNLGTVVQNDDQAILSTLLYEAPELARYRLLVDTEDAKPLTITSALDVWAVGCTLFETAALRPLFLEESRRGFPAGDETSFRRYLAKVQNVPKLREVVEFDRGLGELVARWLLVPDDAKRKTCAQCLSHPYIEKQYKNRSQKPSSPHSSGMPQMLYLSGAGSFEVDGTYDFRNGQPAEFFAGLPANEFEGKMSVKDHFWEKRGRPGTSRVIIWWEDFEGVDGWGVSVNGHHYYMVGGTGEAPDGFQMTRKAKNFLMADDVESGLEPIPVLTRQFIPRAYRVTGAGQAEVDGSYSFMVGQPTGVYADKTPAKPFFWQKDDNEEIVIWSEDVSRFEGLPAPGWGLCVRGDHHYVRGGWGEVPEQFEKLRKELFNDNGPGRRPIPTLDQAAQRKQSKGNTNGTEERTSVSTMHPRQRSKTRASSEPTSGVSATQGPYGSPIFSGRVFWLRNRWKPHLRLAVMGDPGSERLLMAEIEESVSCARWGVQELDDGGMRLLSVSNPSDKIHINHEQLGVGNVPDDWKSGIWRFEMTGKYHESGSKYFRIASAWKPERKLHIQHGPVQAGEVDLQWSSAQWYQESIGGSYIRLKNKWAGRNSALHIENHKVQLGVVEPTWTSARWFKQDVGGGYFILASLWKPSLRLNLVYDSLEVVNDVGDGWHSAHWRKEWLESGYFRLINRWKPDLRLHIEQGVLEVGEAFDDWESAMWREEGEKDVEFILAHRDNPEMVLHIESGVVEAGSGPAQWSSTRWYQEDVRDGRFRLVSAWKPQLKLHIENGTLEVSEVPDHWESALWRSESEAGAISLVNQWRPLQRIFVKNGKLGVGEVPKGSTVDLWRRRLF